MSDKFSILTKASLHSSFLHSNSTTHEFLFGALAELVDNSRDAGAETLKIYSQNRPDLQGENIICFLDDGIGMSPDEAADVAQFGKSMKMAVDHEQPLIGQYGNGLKSGAMRVANDVVLFTKKDSVYTVLLISETFLKKEGIEGIKILIPSFNLNKKPIYNSTCEYDIAKQKHDLEVDLLCKYTPFKTKEELLKNFDDIQGPSGTLVVLYNLKLDFNGDSELEFTEDDIVMRGFKVEYDRKSQLEHKSFRGYVSILYSNPRMKIYIQQVKVQTKLMDRSLYKPRNYIFTSNRFKNKASASLKESEDALKIAQMRFLSTNSEYSEFCKRNDPKTCKDFSFRKTILVREKEAAEKNIENIRLEISRKKKAINEQKQLTFTFGINIHNKYADGLFIYNCNRLIIMFEHPKQQIKNKDYQGICGIVNVPYMVLAPTHNKQQFADSSEQKYLINALGEHMDQYLRDLDIDLDKSFWRSIGYEMGPYVELPSNEEKVAKMRWQKTGMCIQCDRCLKWRELSYHRQFLDPGFPPEHWECENSWDSNKSNCNAIEVLKTLPEGKFDKNYQATNFREIEQDVNVRENRLLTEENRKQIQATLIQKDNNKIVEKSVPGPTLVTAPSLNATRNKDKIWQSVLGNETKRSNNNGKSLRDDDFIDDDSSDDSKRNKRHNESASKATIKKKKLNDLNMDSDSEKNDRNDPDYRGRNGLSKSNKSKPNTVYDYEIINVADDLNSIEMVKENVGIKSEPVVEPSIDALGYRHSLESSTNTVFNNERTHIEMTRNLDSIAREEVIKSLITKHVSLLGVMAMQMEDIELFEKLKTLGEEEVVNLSINDFWKEFINKYDEIKLNKLKTRLRKEKEKFEQNMQKEKDRVNQILQESLDSKTWANIKNKLYSTNE